MQVFKRIANPYMPQGTSALTNSPDLYAPGELGCAFYDPDTGNAVARVKLDSGATASNAVGAVAAGQLAFWKDQVANIVTNDKNQCDAGPSGAINRIAGIFQLAVTAGYYCDIVIQSKSFPVASNGTALVGAQATADTTASTDRVVYTTGVNTAPVSQTIGTMLSSTVTNNKVPVAVSIGFIA